VDRVADDAQDDGRADRECDADAPDRQAGGVIDRPVERIDDPCPSGAATRRPLRPPGLLAEPSVLGKRAGEVVHDQPLRREIEVRHDVVAALPPLRRRPAEGLEQHGAGRLRGGHGQR